MRYSKLKSTTSLVVSLAMVTTPMFAQDAGLPECGETPEFPCLSVDGDLIEDRSAYDELQEAAAAQAAIEAELAAEAEATAAAAAEAEAAAAAAAEAEAAAAEAAANDATNAEAQAAADEAVADAAEAELEAALAAEAAAEAEAAAQAEAQAAADQAAADQAAADAAAAEDAAQAEADAAAEAAALEEAEAAAAAELEAEVEAEAEMTAETEAAEADAEAAADAAAAEEAIAAEEAMEAEAAAAAEEAAEGETTAEAEVDADAMDAAEAAEPLVEPTTVEEQMAAQPQTPEETAEEAPVASAAATADLDTDTVPEDAEVETEIVTEDNVRSSTEDFANSVSAEAAPVVAGNNDREGLSTFQKALLVGLGAAVVGTVLRNGDRVVSNSGDRVVVQRGDNFVVLKDDDVLLRQPGNQVETQTFNDGSTRTIVVREDGSRIVTIRGADGTVQRRARLMPDGTQVELFNDTAGSAPVVVSQLPPAPVYFVETDPARINVTTLREALAARERPAGFDRTFSLNQVRTIQEVRRLAPVVELDTLTFATGSAAIDPDQASGLTDLGTAIAGIVQNDPTQVFLVEGHTDATGPASLNLALSDRRAETVALALTEFFGVPPENLITQGYGESFLKVPTLAAERTNRRVAIRNITTLLR
ncbi:OmpA family protein [Yoonia sp.]|uniref:OmpA family protein n=1 Tax=Yoonia sp. TaxID=2212373 RepID=UPI00391A11FF